MGAAARATDGGGAVSYTHLDVYKRQGLHRFPRGPNPGTFLHGLLEMAAQEGFATLAQDPPRLREALARRCQRRGLESWIDPLQDWLLALLSQPLPLAGADSVVLAQLTQYQPCLLYTSRCV